MVKASTHGQMISIRSHRRRTCFVEAGREVVESEPHGVRFGVGQVGVITDG